MSARLKGTLAKGHGLTDQHARSGASLVVVAHLDPLSCTHFEDGREPQYTFDVAHLEVLDGDAAGVAVGLRLAAYRSRTGMVELPMDGA